MIATAYSSDRFTSGVADDVTVFPRVWRTGRAVIYCHSASMTGGEALGIGQLPAVRGVIFDVLEASVGGGVVAPSLAQLWGTATALGRVDDALDWIRSTGRATDDPPILIASSMGTTTALTWAASRGAAAVIGMIPALDLQAIRELPETTLQTSIDTAYGVTYPESLPPGANPADGNPGCPVQLWYATDDAVSANVDGYASSVGADLNSVGALGHTSTAIAAVDTGAVVEFINSAV